MWEVTWILFVPYNLVLSRKIAAKSSKYYNNYFCYNYDLKINALASVHQYPFSSFIFKSSKWQLNLANNQWKILNFLSSGSSCTIKENTI